MEDSITITLPPYEPQSLCLNTFGHSVTAPGHKYGPSVRSYYLIHFILEGKGTFCVNGNTYSLSKGQGFFIEPDYQTVYTADEQEPWVYIWVAFSGQHAKQLTNSIGLTQDTPIFFSTKGEMLKNYVMEMLEHNRSDPVDRYHNLGMLYLFLSTIADSQKQEANLPLTTANDHISHAISYIHGHINEPVTVEEIAGYVGLNRSYLSALFKKHTGLSPLQYIQTSRITKAEHMLQSSNLSIAAIANSCGYQNPESFMKIFKRSFGVSPSAYRKQFSENAK